MLKKVNDIHAVHTTILQKTTMSTNHTAPISTKYTTYQLSAAEIREGGAIKIPYPKRNKKNNCKEQCFSSAIKCVMNDIQLFST